MFEPTNQGCKEPVHIHYTSYTIVLNVESKDPPIDFRSRLDFLLGPPSFYLRTGDEFTYLVTCKI